MFQNWKNIKENKMEWSEMLTRRSTTFVWDDKVPPKYLIDEILDEVHTHCPSKQRKVPFHIDVLDNYDPDVRPNACLILLENKNFIIQQAISYVKNLKNKGSGKYLDYEYDSAKCIRDVGYVVDGYINDLRYDTNDQIMKIGKKYWPNGKISVRQFAELDAHDYIKDLVSNYILKQKHAPVNQTIVTQKLINDIDVENDAIDHFKMCADTLLEILQNGPLLADPLPGVKRTRFKIFEGTDRKGNYDYNDIRNPQVLAPWLLAFSMRSLTSKQIGLSKDLKNSDWAKQYMQNEIGIASMFAMLSAHSKGLDTAFCGCIQDRNGISTSLGRNVKDELVLFLGIGYKKEGAKKYYNPLIHDYMDIPDKDYDTKPKKTSYIRYHLGK